MTTPVDGPELRATLGDPLPADDVHRAWDGVQRRRHRRAHRRTAIRGGGIVGAAGIVVVGLIGSGWLGGGRDPGALRRTQGNTIEALATPGSPRTVRFADGSSIALDPDASGEIVVNDGRRLVFLLRAGRGRFAVTPGGPRAWSIDAGTVRVDVVGTELAVDRRTDATTVWVDRGAVWVLGADVPDGRARLAAGGVLTIPAARPPVARVAPPSPSRSRAAPTLVRTDRDPGRGRAADRVAGNAGPPPPGHDGAGRTMGDPAAAVPDLDDPPAPSPATPAAGTSAPGTTAALGDAMDTDVSEAAPPGTGRPRAWDVWAGALTRRHFGGPGPWLVGAEAAVRIGPMGLGVIGAGGRQTVPEGRVRFGVVAGLVRVRMPVGIETDRLRLTPWLRGELGVTSFGGQPDQDRWNGRRARAVYASALVEAVLRLRVEPGPDVLFLGSAGYAAGLEATGGGGPSGPSASTGGWLMQFAVGLVVP